jgi:hypothetical protein
MGERAEGGEGVSKQGPYLKTSQYAPSTTTRGLWRWCWDGEKQTLLMVEV